MKNYTEERSIEVYKYIVTGNSISDASKVFGISESTVRRDIVRLRKINPDWYKHLKLKLAGMNISAENLDSMEANVKFAVLEDMAIKQGLRIKNSLK